jgi:hypothetical protein
VHRRKSHHSSYFETTVKSNRGLDTRSQSTLVLNTYISIAFSNSISTPLVLSPRKPSKILLPPSITTVKTLVQITTRNKLSVPSYRTAVIHTHTYTLRLCASASESGSDARRPTCRPPCPSCSDLRHSKKIPLPPNPPESSWSPDAYRL